MHQALAVICASTAAAIAAIVADISEMPVAAFSGPAILDNERLRLICIVGALGGAVLNLGLYDSPQPGIRPMAWKVFGSCITGVIFTPVAVHWMNVTPNTDNLLAVSFLTAIVSVGLLRKVLPALSWAIGAKLGVDVNGPGRTGGEKQPAQRSQPTKTP